MYFSVTDILLLENITYLAGIPPLTDILDLKGKTVAEAVNAIALDELVEERDYATYMNGFDWKNLLLAIRKNPKVMECYIAETHYDNAYGGGGGKSAVFLCESQREAVVAFRGTADKEWLDDFRGGNTIDSLQQINALEWYKKVYEQLGLENYKVTVTGHSKGGNKAKYIAILDDTPVRCISFDGQGFSDEFMSHYRERILKRQGMIENHNVDFDYVNILLNDIGSKVYYTGFDYGKGGFAEAHCPNTYFKFGEDGEFTVQINPDGQRPEMQVLDQFINSMARSNISEKEKNETMKLVGMLVEKSCEVGTKITPADFATFVCDIVGTEEYANNAAYLIAFCIKYAREVPDFFTALKTILIHFKMGVLLSLVDVMRDLVRSQKLNVALHLSNFLVLRVNHLLAAQLRALFKKKYNLDVSTEQIRRVLVVVSMTQEMLRELNIVLDGSDILLEELEETEQVVLPENLKVVVLAGGLSSLRNRSLKTGFTVAEVLKKLGHRVIVLDAFLGYGENECLIADAFADADVYSLPQSEVPEEIPDLWALKKRRRNHSDAYFGPNVLTICRQSDLVFIALQGSQGECGKVQAAFDMLGIDYTGNDYFSSALASNKALAKRLMLNQGIAVPEGVRVGREEAAQDPAKFGFSYPMVVKLCTGGIGLGVFVVNDRAAYQKALKEAFQWEGEVVVERLVLGREISIGMLNGKLLPAVERLPIDKRQETGSHVPQNLVCPAEIPKGLEKRLAEVAARVNRCLGLQALSMVDFIVTSDGAYVCVGCDPLPELTEDSKLVLAAERGVISFEELCMRMIEQAEKNVEKRML